MRYLGLKQCPIFKEKGDFLITSEYGERIHPVTGEKTFHSGVDGVRGAHDLATITAIDDGIIKDVYKDCHGYSAEYPLGNYVRIIHVSGRETLYLHLAYGTIPATIFNGAAIKKGASIGYMGNTGRSTGAHVHFQVYNIDGKTIIEPTQFLLGRSINNLEEIETMFVICTPCKYKDKGDNVKNLQIKLAQLSQEFSDEIAKHSRDATGNVDGVFGKGLIDTVKKFQKYASIPITGECDESTCLVLNDTIYNLNNKITQVKRIVE